MSRRDEVISRFWQHRLNRCQYEYGYKRATTPEMGPWRRDNGRVPCSRYGDDGEECAWWAVALGFIFEDANGDGFTPEGMEHFMSLAVNDHDDVAELVWDYWHAVPKCVRRHIGTRASVKRLMA